MSAYDGNNFYIYWGSDFGVGKVSRAAGTAFVLLFIFSLVSADDGFLCKLLGCVHGAE